MRVVLIFDLDVSELESDLVQVGVLLANNSAGV